MDENIYRIAEQIVQLHQKAYEVYLPLVEDVCTRTVSEDELSHLLDYLLDFACDEKMLGLYKRVCRKYLDVYPGCIRDHIDANVKHFFTLLGKMFFTPYGKEFFTYPGKQIFTS